MTGARPATWAEMRKRIVVKDMGVTEWPDPEDDTQVMRFRTMTAFGMGLDGKEYGVALQFAPDSTDIQMVNAEKLALLAVYNKMREAKAWAAPLPTANEFLVGTNGDKISIGHHRPGGLITKDQALGLAAWLVMCAAYGELDRFSEILNAIKET